LQKQYQDFDSLANSNHYWMPISRTIQNEVALVDLCAARSIVFFGISSPGRDINLTIGMISLSIAGAVCKLPHPFKNELKKLVLILNP